MIGPEAVGTKLDPMVRSWTSTDTLLYALSVGAGADDPTSELEFTTENSHKVTQRALPTFAVLAAGCGGVVEPAAMAAVGLGPEAAVHGVHGAQELELLEDVPVEGSVRIESEVSAVEQKKTGLTMTVESVALDVEDGRRVFVARSTVFFRGMGDPSKADASAEQEGAPAGEPTVRLTYATRPDQALLYRLNGDRNPLHSDPKFAKLAGFERPILHGLCTFGFAGRALLHGVFDGDPGRFGVMYARFTKPVLPGDRLTVDIWRGARSHFAVATEAGSKVLEGWCEAR